MSLAQLIYTSEIKLDGFRSGRPVSEELHRMIERAQEQNRKVLVTGILLYSAGHFLQLLEGHPLVLKRLYHKISQDPRHTNVEQLAYYSVDSRLFDHWFMRMLNLDERRDLDPAIFHRFKDNVRSFLDDQTAQKNALQLLKEFKDCLQADAEEERPQQSVHTACSSAVV